jgi:hypothetical protein
MIEPGAAVGDMEDGPKLHPLHQRTDHVLSFSVCWSSRTGYQKSPLRASPPLPALDSV